MEDGMAVDDRRKPLDLPNLIARSIVSFVFVLCTQSAIALVSHFFSSYTIFIQLPLSVLILVGVAGFGRWIKRLIGVHASAPAFVFFNIVFLSTFYAAVVRKAVSNYLNFLLTGQFILLIIGLSRILSSDPGFALPKLPYSDEKVKSYVSVIDAFDKEIDPLTGGLHHNYPSEASASILIDRIRFCNICKRWVKGFDHHCPAFGNCIGDNNHRLFIILLIGFISTEATYVVCLSHYHTKFQILDTTILETSLSRAVATGTYLFSILQLLWQVIFLLWHIYCICFNIRTDEWINWKKYPEFQVLVDSQPGQSSIETRFVNPYAKGVLYNLKEFLI